MVPPRYGFLEAFERIDETGCSKSQFDTALKNLQISMNVVRDSAAEQDTWLTFQEVHAEIWNKHVRSDV